VAYSYFTTPLQVRARFFSPGAGDPVIEDCAVGLYDFNAPTAALPIGLRPAPPAGASTSDQTARGTSSSTSTVGLTVLCVALVLVVLAGLVAVRRRTPDVDESKDDPSADVPSNHYYPQNNDLFDEAPHVRANISSAAASVPRRTQSPHVLAEDYQGSHYFPWHARDEPNIGIVAP
jgi:hypothetical protein